MTKCGGKESANTHCMPKVGALDVLYTASIVLGSLLRHLVSFMQRRKGKYLVHQKGVLHSMLRGIHSPSMSHVISLR